MARKTFDPPTIWKPFGAFSMVAIQGQGQVVHLKGQVSLDADGNVVGHGNMAAQVDTCLENIRLVLESLGGRMEDVYSLVHHVTDIDGFMKTGEIRAKYFAPPYPVTTTVEVSRLYHPDLLVEITSSAEIPVGRFSPPSSQDA